MSDGWSLTGVVPRWQGALDTVGAAVFAVVLGGLSAAAGEWSWLPAVGLLALALALRNRQVWPMIVLAVLAALVQVVSTDVVYPADAAYAVLFFVLGAHAHSRVRLVGLSCAVVATVVGGLFMSLQLDPSVAGESSARLDQLIGALLFAMLTALFTVGGWVAGYIRWLNRRAMQAGVDARLDAAERRRLQDAVDQEHERARIAADMHDVVAHSWAVVAAQADGARYSIRNSPGAAERALEVIGETARSTIADLRVILARLRYEESSGTTPGYEQQRALFARMRASGMLLNDTEVGIRSSSPLVAMTAFRLLSESLTNALKHADLGVPVEVRQDWTQGYHLTVRNTTPDREVGEGTGQGIIGMRERATVAGGTLTAGRIDHRWVVDADLPPPVEEPAQSEEST